MAETVHLVLGTDAVTAWLREQIWASRSRLAAAGLALPPGGRARQRAAVADLVGDPSGEDPWTWDTLADKIAGQSRPCVLVPAERLHAADPAVHRRVVSSLAPAAVHVLHPLAPPALAGVLAWQEELRAGATHSFAQWMSRAAPPHPADVLEPWLELLPPDQVHLVVGDSPETVAERTCALLGAGSALRSAAVEVLPAVDAEVLRHYNQRVHRHAEEPSADPDVRRSEDRVVRPGFRAGPVAALPVLPGAGPWWDRLRELAPRIDVVGGLEEPTAVPTAAPPGPEELLDAGLRLWVRQLEGVGERLDRALEARRRRVSSGGENG